MLSAFDGLAIGLEAVAHVLEQLPDLRAADQKLLQPEFSCQNPSAFDRPPQRRHRIAARAGLNKPFKRPAELWLLFLAGLSPAARPSLATGAQCLRGFQFRDPHLNGRTCQAGRLGDGGDPTPPQRHGLRGRPPAGAPLVKVHQDCGVLAMDRLNKICVLHARSDRR